MTRVRPVALGVLVLAGTVLGGCSSSDHGVEPVTRAEFEAHLQEAADLTPTQASCATTKIFRAYDDQAVRSLYDAGLSGLPSGDWSAYGQALVGCVFGAGS